MDIAFSTAQVQSGAEHGLLMTLRESALGDDAAVHAFYEKVIGSLALEGNYMILLCHDSYDVFSYHKDGGRSEDSGEIFRYILCAICPVSMAKPVLSYFVRDNCFRNITADSVVAPPALGFLFPAFDNRSTNLYGALYYTRDTSDSHEEFTDAVFRAGKLPMPAAAQQETFRNVLAESVGRRAVCRLCGQCAQICQAVEDHGVQGAGPLTVDKYALRDMLGFGGPRKASTPLRRNSTAVSAPAPPSAPAIGGYTQIRGRDARCRDPRQSGASRAGRDPHHRRRKVHSHPRR